MQIYIDILLITNWIIGYIFLQIVGKLCSLAFRKHGLFCGSCLCSAVSLLIVFDLSGTLIQTLVFAVKILCLLVIAYASFKVMNLRQMARAAAGLVFVNILFAGTALLFWQFFGRNTVYIKNCTVYLDISLMSIFIITTATYILISLYQRCIIKKFRNHISYTATFFGKDFSVTLPAVADSGNLLVDVLSGESIVVFKSSKLAEYFGMDKDIYPNIPFRLITAHTQGESLLIPIIRCERLAIVSQNGESKFVRCLVGIVNPKENCNDERVVFNPDLLD